MSAVANLSDPHSWTDDQLATNVSQVADEMVHALKLDVGDLAEQVDIKRSTLYTRLNGSSKFTAAELFRLADVLGVSMEAFFRPVDDLRRELAGWVQNWKKMNPTGPAGVMMQNEQMVLSFPARVNASSERHLVSVPLA